MTDLSPHFVPDTMELLRPVLPAAPATVCEVGCGRGALAAALGAAGYTVTGLEPDEDSAADARRRGVDVRGEELVGHRAPAPYDAVLFTRSLHHIEDLDAAVAHALGMLAPGGVLVCEEFARERADAAAAAFLFDTLTVLVAAGAAEPGDQPAEADADTDPLARWTEAFHDPHHRHHPGDGPPPPVHDTDDIVAVLRRHGLEVSDRPTATMWRMVSSRLLDLPAAPAVARTVRALERRRIADGTLPPLGRFLVCHRPAAPVASGG